MPSPYEHHDQKLENMRLESYQKMHYHSLTLSMESEPAFDEEHINKIQQLRKATEEHETLMQNETHPIPDVDSDYKLFPNGKGDDAYEWLKKEWGYWLSHFNKNISKDYLFQNELRKRDPDLMNRLRAQRKRILANTGLDVKKIIPTISTRVDEELANLKQDELTSAFRINSSWHRRKANKNTVDPSP